MSDSPIIAGASTDPEIGGYRLLRVLSVEQTVLCSDVSGNVVVLKRLEKDCLHRNQLHPSIRQRLARVREVAHPRIAALRSVERWEGAPWLVWKYLEGQIWEDAVASSGIDQTPLCCELAATVAALHENGLVHGALHGRNVIVRSDRRIWLTHLSPYLYTDPQADITAVVELIRGLASPSVTPYFLGRLEQLQAGQIGLRELSNSGLGAEQAISEAPPPAVSRTERVYRISSLLMAAALVILAVAAWFTLNRLLSK